VSSMCVEGSLHTSRTRLKQIIKFANFNLRASYKGKQATIAALAARDWGILLFAVTTACKNSIL
jgi:hypothetical protein